MKTGLGVGEMLDPSGLRISATQRTGGILAYLGSPEQYSPVGVEEEMTEP